MGWLGKVEGDKATLFLVEKSKPLQIGTTYVITGKIINAQGLSVDIGITFVTRAKE